MIRSPALRETLTLFPTDETGPADRYGNPTMVEAASVVVRAAVSPLDATENEVLADTRVSRYRAIVVSAAGPLDAFSRVVWRGRSFEVIGEPQVFVARRGVHHHEFDMREILGG